MLMDRTERIALFVPTRKKSFSCEQAHRKGDHHSSQTHVSNLGLRFQTKIETCAGWDSHLCEGERVRSPSTAFSFFVPRFGAKSMRLALLTGTFVGVSTRRASLSTTNREVFKQRLENTG